VNASANAADVEEVLQLSEHQVAHEYGATPTQPQPWLNPNPDPNVAWPGLPPRSNGFFRDSCATFPPNFVKVSLVIFA